jgi:hypothetical protein
MINIIPSNKRHHGQHGWLDAHWHFSFGDYQDPNNMNWRALRVFTDDIIHAVGGFDIHPIAIWKLSPLFTRASFAIRAILEMPARFRS